MSFEKLFCNVDDCLSCFFLKEIGKIVKHNLILNKARFNYSKMHKRCKVKINLCTNLNNG